MLTTLLFILLFLIIWYYLKNWINYYKSGDPKENDQNYWMFSYDFKDHKDHKMYWKKDIQNPMSRWRATIKRGFDFPPNATSNSFDAESHGGIVKNEGEFWTGHPIVELVPHWARKHHDGGNDHFCDNASLVRVTLQGIPSGLHVRKDDMVPLSLVFEAFFQSDEMRK